MTLMKPIPRPAMTRATMNMFEFWEADINAPPVAQNNDPIQTPVLRPYLSAIQPPRKQPNMAPK